MKVYCAAPIRGNIERKIFSIHIPALVAKNGCTPMYEIVNPGAKPPDEEIFARDLEWLEQSRCVVAEVSSASTGVGFEVAYALYKLKIPVLGLYHEESAGTVSAMISGCPSSLLIMKSYKDMHEMEEIIRTFLQGMK